ncbi:hypothetical protein [Neolewinella sp.]|uniref:hypothetical protein n=1 Tax=Neolewinella sp. TaxID=2993543 RepID=UPI003B519F16
MKPIYPFALYVLATACTSTPQKTGAAVAGCYTYAENNSRVAAELETHDQTVEGTLTYDLYQKDRNQGTFNGILHGDTLIGVYTFQSEGRTSKREVAFLRQGEQLREGYGDSDLVGDVQRFSSPNELVFGQGVVLARVPCED